MTGVNFFYTPYTKRLRFYSLAFFLHTILVQFIFKVGITQPGERGCMSDIITDQNKSQEKRDSPRYDSIKKIKYKVLIPMEGKGFTQNISKGGYALFLDKEVPPGSVLELKFQIPGKTKEPEKSIVKVIWQKDYLTGVKVLGR